MDAHEIAEAKTQFNKKIGHIKRRITNVTNFLEMNEYPDTEELESRLDSVEKAYSDFQIIMNEIVECLTEDDFNENYLTDVNNFEDRYHKLRSQILRGCKSNSHNNKEKGAAPNTSSELTVPRPNIRLPELNIPNFDGDPLKWITFRDIFEAVINSNSALTDIVKFTYLQNSLKGDAKQSLGHLEISDAGYKRAWAELVQRYDNPRIIVEKHIDELIDLQQVHSSNAVEMRKFVNVVFSHVTALEACEMAFDTCSEVVVIRLVIRKLDRETIKEWEKQVSAKEPVTWPQFREFLEQRCRVLDSITNSSQNSSKPMSNSFTRQTNRSSFYKPRGHSVQAYNTNTNQSRPMSCKICNGLSHAYFSCPTFLKLVPADRFNKIKDLKACINCLNPAHTVLGCRSSGCKICTKKHHTLLHLDQRFLHSNDNNTPRNDTMIQQPSTSTTGVERTDEHQNFSIQKQMPLNKIVILPTAIVLLKRPNGKYVECRALLDSGSQSNFITSFMARKIGCEVNSMNPIELTGISTMSTKVNEMISTEIKSRFRRSSFNVDLLVINKISNNLPQVTFDINRWSIPPNIQLADPDFNESRQIDILIGAELFPEILLPGKTRLKQYLPTLQDSLFGWLIFGKQETAVQQTTHTSFIQNNDQLSTQLTKFWEIENLPTKRFLSANEEQCEKHFRETHYRDNSGRYHVFLPLNDSISLGDSKQMAAKRLMSLERKLNSNSALKVEYIAFMKEYVTLNHMEEVDVDNQTDNEEFYIPHHAILRPNSSSTNLRVVFDASARSSNGKSLNDKMLVGPTVQSELFTIILRFRKYKYAMTSDITKMYRQVYVDRSQTRLQRILWREDSCNVMKVYELKTITYGTAAAPFLATRAIKQLASDDGSNFPLASQALLFDTYVDDIVTGAETLSDALQLQSQLCQLTNRGCFQLHKWCANNDRLLKDIPENDRETTRCNEFGTGEYIKALGMFWQPSEDFFVFKPPEFNNESKVTKRTILSDVAKLFDPLGLLAPVIVTAKLMMQDLWKHNSDWDDNVSVEIKKDWDLFKNDLISIADIQLPRCIYKKDSVAIRTELHGFADASEKAYGACLYIRTIDADDNVTVNLVCSKSRVAPLKTITLPHLELCAALLVSKVVTAVIDALNIVFDDVVLWTDSTITLYWISTPPYKLKTFVANRVNEIQQHTVNFTWNHVISKNNPADIVSRGIMPNQLKDLVMWWKGPSILHSKHVASEVSNLNSVEGTVDLELKQNKSIYSITSSNNLNGESLSIFVRFSSYNKLIRITAYCLRFIKRCRRLLVTSLELTVQELNDALNRLVRGIQLIAFEKEIKLLSSNKDLPPNSKIKSLTPFLDANKVLRVGGRLKNVNVDYDVKHQILLPSHHKFVELIFYSEHRNQCHAGPQLLLSLVRRKFWPIAGKNLAKQIVRNCIICARSKPTITKQIMGNLPHERVSQTKPFLNCGVDYCGPFFIRNKFQRKSAPYKVYVASFVCFSTKSMHLEMVSDLTSQSFIACLKRFLARRGTVANIWSDNATNFVGADHEIKQLYHKFISQAEQTKIISFCSNEQIKWNFIPPRAPNFGGLWEASIKSFKFHLNRVTKGTVLTLEEFQTLVIQIEGILNSRPLTCLSDDPHDPQPLTPNHFLTGGPSTSLSEPPLSEIPDNCLTKWQRISKMTESFWKRYSIEYLHTLQTRTKWKQEMPNLHVNDIVMLVDDNIPSIRWSLGRIISVIAGKDSKVRVIEIKTNGRILRRAISKVVKLPV